jgi:pimeloyl-ACP methyl ester carboxylesterase
MSVPIDLEYRFEPGTKTGAAGGPPLVFLHEGLGSVGLWRDFPEAVWSAAGRSSSLLVYSRAGHGQSAPVFAPRSVDYMHDEALDVLPKVLAAFGLDRPVLIGHSDGASIALIHAGAGHPVAGLVLIAPHVFVEDVTIRGIEAAREAFLTTDLPERMARHHVDAKSTFWGWNRIWLSPEFRSWNIENWLPAMECPVLVIQGDADEYGTLGQVDAIERTVSGPVETVIVAASGHSPHLTQQHEVLAATVRFLQSLTPQ